MKVATKEIGNSQIVLDIEVEDERLEKAVDQAYRRVVNRINVPGFRRGKAPRALVERMVGREALVEDAVEHLVPEVVEAAVKEQDIKMVARPRLEVVSTQPLQVKATVPVKPKVELGDYRSLEIARQPADVDDEKVQGVLDRLRESHATWEPVERVVERGDRVALDLNGRVEEQTLVDSKDAEYVVDPEGPQPAPGFADQLLGMKIDEERSFVLTLPEDYRRRELANKPADFTVTIHGVKERRLPDVDDDFAKTVGDEYETAEQLRAGIHKQLLESEEQTRTREHEDAVIQSVVDQAKVDLPPQLVEEESQRHLDQLSSSLDRQGITVEQYLRFTGRNESQLRAELMAQGERSVRRSEVLNAVARAEGFEASDDEVRQELVGAETDAAEVERANRLLDSAAIRERIANLLLERKAARFLLESIGGIKLDEGATAEESSAEPSGDQGAPLYSASREKGAPLYSGAEAPAPEPTTAAAQSKEGTS